MKISFNDEVLFELSPQDKAILGYNINEDILEADVKRRIKWVIGHKLTRVKKEMRDQWLPKLIADGLEAIPTDDKKLMDMIMAHPNFKSRKERDMEENRQAAEPVLNVEAPSAE